MSNTNNKPKNQEFLSPKCIASYPKLLVPDTKFKKEGQLGVKLIMTAEQAEEVRKQAEPIMAAYIAANLKEAREQAASSPKTKPTLAAKEKAAKNGFTMSITDQIDEAGEPTGMKEVAFKQAAQINYKDKTGAPASVDIHIPIFDAKGKQIVTHVDNRLVPNAIQIWSGSELKVRYQIIPAYVPVKNSETYHATLRPVAVQVVKLVSGGGVRSAEEYGFGEEEGGYEAPAEAPTMAPAGAEGDAGNAADY